MKHVYVILFCLQISIGLLAMEEKRERDPRLSISFIVNRPEPTPQVPLLPHATEETTIRPAPVDGSTLVYACPECRSRRESSPMYPEKYAQSRWPLVNRFNRVMYHIQHNNVAELMTELRIYPYPEFQLLSHGFVTPLHELLVAAPYLKDRKQLYTGNTLMHIACGRAETLRFRRIINILIGHGFNINAQNNGGDTPIHVALRQCRFNWAKLLLQHRANPLIKNFRDETAFDTAHMVNAPSKVFELMTQLARA